MEIEAGLVVLLLVVVWFIALLPFALRKFSEWQVRESVTRFGCQNRALGRALPAPFTPRPVEPARPTPRSAVQAAARRRREKALQLMARRRRTLATLLSVLASTVVLGAIPQLRVLWYISLMALLLTAGYVALLIRFQRAAELAAVASERAEKVVPIHRRSEENDRGRLNSAPRLPARPAFVLVDARA